MSTKQITERMAKIIKNSVADELIKELVSKLGKEPDGSWIDDLQFIKRTFWVKIENNGSINIFSNWKHIGAYIRGEDVINRPDIAEAVDDEDILSILEINKDEPTDATETQWVHPAVRKNFIERGVNKGIKMARKEINNYVNQILTGG